MARPKSVRTDRVWLRDDFNDKLDKFDEELKLGEFLHSHLTDRPSDNISGMERKDRQESRSHERNTAFSTMPAHKRLIIWPFGYEWKKVSHRERHTVEKSPRRGANDRCTHRVHFAVEPAQLGWALPIGDRKATKVDTAEIATAMHIDPDRRASALLPGSPCIGNEDPNLPLLIAGSCTDCCRPYFRRTDRTGL